MNQKGTVIILVATTMGVFIGMCALALDISHLYVVRNELQNAADAGALAGVRFLYNPDGFVNPLANVIARNAAISNDNGDTRSNKADKIDVEVLAEEVERGHWSFSDKTFTAIESLLPVEVTPPYSFSDLDSNVDFVNAVRIKTRRGGTPGGTQALSFFSRFWGFMGFNMEATAVAYMGWGQSITPDAIDKPIAICLEAITEGGEYSCRTGRMINSSGSGADTNTAGWTNYSQGSDCSEANASDMNALLNGCGGGNSTYLMMESTLGLTNGMQTGTFQSFRDCWKTGSYDTNGDDIPDSPLPLDSRGYPTKPWRIKIAVVSCGEGFQSINGCRQRVLLKGTVSMDVLWVSKPSADPHYNDIPMQMDDGTTFYNCSATDEAGRIACWNDFVNRFDLRNYDQGGSPTPYLQKAIYVKPVCEPKVGPTMGPQFSWYWKNPVLVN